MGLPSVNNGDNTSAAALLTLPIDLFEGCLLFCQPRDIFNVSLTCKRAHRHLSRNESFWRRVFLQLWDDVRQQPNPPPSTIPSVFDVPWSERVWRIDAALRAIQNHRANDHDLAVVVDLLAHSTPSYGASSSHSRNLTAVQEILADPDTLAAACIPNRFDPLRHLRSRTISREQSALALSQNSAKLSAMWMSTTDIAPECRDAARSRVYDLSRYSEDTAFGPFTPERDLTKAGQRVDWVQLDAIARVLRCNVDELFDLESEELNSIVPREPKHARPYTLPKPSNPKDWAGIEGKWRRVVCFLDYRDLFVFNIRRLQGHNPIVHSDEAVRMLSMEINITKIGAPEDPEDTLYPTLFFEGLTMGGTPHESACRGSVRLMADGNVKWESISHYSGEDRWSTVAVQVGGIQASRGFLGVWSGIDHAFEDPAGPTWIYKRSKHDDFP